MNLQSASQSVYDFMLDQEDKILDKFANSNRNSLILGKGHIRSVFIPGTRKDRALLVAHVDTVWHDTPKLRIGYQDGVFYSLARSGLDPRTLEIQDKGYGIGADDRAGIAMLWALKDMGHSILLTNSEEAGCVGSMCLMGNNEIASWFQDHTFAVQFDRKNEDDLVFYKVGSEAFAKYCEDNTGYKTAIGTFSDIGVLCRDICGVNMSVGYKNEHTEGEVLNMHWWMKTHDAACKWLSKELIKFSRPKLLSKKKKKKNR
jgi:hypothetical protein